jgi:superfamily I DNA and/or RNA helicase
VVASLVRSNPKNQIGFLGVADAEQRINVLCTRARMGFIVVGNFACLENRSPVWQRLMGHMRASGSVFQGLPTKCQRHGVRLHHHPRATPRLELV